LRVKIYKIEKGSYMAKFKIVTDSSSDLRILGDIPFAVGYAAFTPSVEGFLSVLKRL